MKSQLPPDPKVPRPMRSASNFELRALLHDLRTVDNVFGKIASRARLQVREIMSILKTREDSQRPNPNRRNRKSVITDPLKLSDHFIVRYLQRAKGLDMEALEKEISDLVENSDHNFGGLHIDTRENMIFMVSKEGVFKTVLKSDMIGPDGPDIYERDLDIPKP